jgi:hypothetical protein
LESFTVLDLWVSASELSRIEVEIGARPQVWWDDGRVSHPTAV